MNLITKDLIEDLKKTKGFYQDIEEFIVNVIQYLFGISTSKPDIYSPKQLIEIANILSLSDNEDDRKLSYLLSTYCWLIYEKENPEIYSVIKLILSRLGNFPAQKLINDSAAQKQYRNIFLQLEDIGLELNNKIPFIKNLILTDFQLQLWEYLENNQSISFSAPTSSGKSFILKKYSVKKMKESEKSTILYILPSRALINETSTDLLDFLKEEKMQEEVLVTSIPTDKSNNNKIIYVLTQERATMLIEQNPDVKFDLIIVDEAQSIENAQRGIILQNVISIILENNKNVPIIFSSPFVENLDIFNNIFNKNVKVLPNKSTNVIQNLISININENDINLSLVGDINKEIGSVPLEINCYNISKKKNRLAFLAKHFTQTNDKSIIYANGPAEAEDIAQLLYDQTNPIMMSDSLKELSRYIKTHLHTKFSLALMLERGVAFHYGDLPQSIRKNIEEEFKKSNGQIKYLVCTSTLLEGVNLPAKNIFIENPHKGKESSGIPLSQHEFWNLAGRAGRLTKDFYGNVFLVNYNCWDKSVDSSNKNKKIGAALFDTINNDFANIIEYANTRNNDKKFLGSIESSINILYVAQKENNLQKLLSNKSIQIKESIKDQLVNSIENLTTQISLPAKIIKQNPYISIINQQKLYDYFSQKIENKALDTCLPKHPMSNDKNSLLQIFYRINNCLFAKEQRESMKKRIREITPNAILWMKGLPVNLMIKNYVEYREGNAKRAVDINSCVRHVLEVIEKDIRFKFSVTSKCYNDILTYCYFKQGIEKKIEPIHLYLEMGACNQTMISLMGIGLSRPTAATVEDKIANKSLDENQVYDWLKNNRNNLQTLKITGLTLEEINSFL